MRKLLLATMAIGLVCIANAQTITPFVLNAAGGTAKVNDKFYLDWSVAEMTLVNTMQNYGYKELFIITNGFLQPPKDDAEGDEDISPYVKSLKPEVNNLQLLIYPNPASTYITVDIPVMEETDKIRLTMYNSTGQLVYEKEVTTNGYRTKERISMAEFTHGTYLLRVQMGAPGTPTRNIMYKIFKAQ